MKKSILLICLLLILVVIGYSQASFITGPLEVDVNSYGRIRLYDSEGVRHLQRASILVGTSANAVFDYPNDAEENEPTVLVTSPLVSDYEIFGAYDNTYSGAPPNVIVKLNAYGWTNKSYTILKFNVKNNGALPINALIGLDIIPEINQEYGFDSVTYNPTARVIRFHRGNQVNMGMTLLSAPLTSLYSFEWYDGYSVDSDYWQWMNYGSIQPFYASNTADGPVSITSQAAVPLGASATTDVYYALALGTNEQSMLASIAEAVAKYNLLFTSVNEPIPASMSINLEKNYPNPFSQSTTIKYSIPSSGFVTLKVFDALGVEVATLVKEDQLKGGHSVEFDAGKLAGGVYYYSLSFNNQVRTHKMFVVK